MVKNLSTNKKLLKTGIYTYMVTLPKEWVRELGWRCKQKLALTLKGKSVVIQDNTTRKTADETKPASARSSAKKTK